MIELFSRTPGMLDLPEDADLTPIPVEDDVVTGGTRSEWYWILLAEVGSKCP